MTGIAPSRVARAAAIAWLASAWMVFGACIEGAQPGGALYRICMPDSWNGDLVIYAHGFVPANESLAVPEETLPNGTSMDDVILKLGFAYATTSYRDNGLVIPDAVQDVRELAAIFDAAYGRPNHKYLLGASAGGLVTTLALEQYPGEFSGGMALCAPIGDFAAQINYIDDFRTVFDCFFPRVLPGSAVSVPSDVIRNWYGTYERRILAAILRRPASIRQVMKITHAAFDPRAPYTIAESTLDLLWYQAFNTTDAQQKLGGQPYDNSRRLYRGSSNDRLLNRLVLRARADGAALAELKAHYQTSGRLAVPLVVMTTTLDDIVPAWHSATYRSKVIRNRCTGSLFYKTVPRYGHCNFTAGEVLAGFVVLQNMVNSRP